MTLSVTVNPLLSVPGNPPRSVILDATPKLRRPSRKRQLIHMLNVANAARELGELPATEESIHVVMRGNFHGWDLVPAVLRLAAPATIRTLYVATLGFNMQNAAELVSMLDDGRVGRVEFVCSCYFKSSCPEEFTALASNLVQRGQRIVAARSHAKILLMALSDGRRLVIESSANLRSCRNIEQFCMTESTALYDFHREWIAQVIDVSTNTKATHGDHPKK